MKLEYNISEMEDCPGLLITVRSEKYSTSFRRINIYTAVSHEQPERTVIETRDGKIDLSDGRYLKLPNCLSDCTEKDLITILGEIKIVPVVQFESDGTSNESQYGTALASLKEEEMENLGFLRDLEFEERKKMSLK